MPIVLYQIPASGPCRAVMMTAQHLGIKLTLKHVDLFTGEQMKSEFLKMNPQHCVPTIDDDGFYLWESRVIMTYLVNKFSKDCPLYPMEPTKRAAVDRMLYFDLGTLYKAQLDLRSSVFGNRPAEKEKEENFKKALELLEVLLEGNAYAAGNHLTLADFSLIGSLSFCDLVGGYSLEAYPNISAWYKKAAE